MDAAVPAPQNAQKALENEGLASLSLDEVFAELVAALDDVRETLTKAARFLRGPDLNGEVAFVLRELEAHSDLLRDHVRMNLD